MELYTIDLSIVFSICAIVCTIYFLLTKLHNKRHFPPSPSPTLPIFGNLFCLDHSLHTSLAKLSKKHGPIMLLKLGQLPTIVISSASAAKEALKKHDITFSNRTVLDTACIHDHNLHSLVFLPPTLKWRNLRKLCNSQMFSARKLDNGRTIRETKVNDLNVFVKGCASSKTLVNIGEEGFTVVLNVLSTTLFSIDLGDPTSEFCVEFRKLFRHILAEIGKPNVSDFFPIMRKFDLQGIKRNGKVYIEKIYKVFDDIIQKRLKERNSVNYAPYNDVLDSLLDMKPEEADYIHHSVIPHLFLDLIIAGSLTTSNTIEWVMAELLHNPHTLEKLQSELQKIIGKGNSVGEGHITDLPYLQAVVKETLRLHPPAPIPVPRKIDSDVSMFGFTLPANSMVLFNVWAIGRDPDFWESPENFEPGRFLGSIVDVKGHDFELIPFGAGRRICPGMPLAMRVIPLMISSLVHDFDWTLEDGVTPENMNMEERSGFIVEKAQRLCAFPICRF